MGEFLPDPVCMGGRQFLEAVHNCMMGNTKSSATVSIRCCCGITSSSQAITTTVDRQGRVPRSLVIYRVGNADLGLRFLDVHHLSEPGWSGPEVCRNDWAPDPL